MLLNKYLDIDEIAASVSRPAHRTMHAFHLKGFSQLFVQVVRLARETIRAAVDAAMDRDLGETCRVMDSHR